MAKIKASLADVSTEFKPLEPGLYEFEIVKVDEVEKEEQFVAWKVQSKVTTTGDFHGKTVMDYIHVRQPNEEISSDNIGLSTMKRYFEVTHGKDEVASWTDEDYDTDLLIGKGFQAQVAITSYTPKGQTEPRKANEFKRMEPLD